MSTEKKYAVVLAMNFIDSYEDLIQTTCLTRDGKTIGHTDYRNGVPFNSLVIDGLSRELAVYFSDESRDILKLAQKP